MTKWILRLALAALLVLGGLWGWHSLFPGPEQAIKKRLAQLAETASTTGDEGLIPKAARVQKLTTFFTQDVQISIDMPGQFSAEISGTDDLTRVAAAARSMGKPVKIELLDVSVTLGPDRNSAEARMTGAATIPGDKAPQVQELQAELRKMNGEWLIYRAQTVRTLR